MAPSGSWKAAGVVAVVASCVAAGILLRPPKARPPDGPSGPTVVSRQSVAVFGFRNRSGRVGDAWFSTALAEALTAELAASERLRVVPSANVARMKEELALVDGQTLAADALGRVRERLGVDLVVLGSYLASGSALSLDVLLLDAAGRTLGAISAEGSATDVRDVVARSARQIRESVGIPLPSRTGTEAAGASLPSGADAMRLYASGLDRLRHFDALGSRDLLAAAVAASPGSALPRAALADALAALGYDALAAQEAKRALDLSTGLPHEQRLIVEGQFHEATKAWGKAIDTYRALERLAPTDASYPLRVADAQIAAGRYRDALQTLAALRAAHPASDTARFDLVEARAANGLAEFARAQATAARAASAAVEARRPLLLAQARLAEVYALRGLGESNRALVAGDEALQAYSAAGDRGGVARAMVMRADVLRYQGDLDQAREMAEGALALAEQLGYKAVAAQAQNRLGTLLEAEGRLFDSKRAYEQSLALWIEVGDRDWEATALNNIGNTLRHYGSLREADERFERCLALFLEIGDQHGVAFSLFNRAFVKLDQGDLAAAEALLERSLERARAITEPSLEAVALSGLGEVRAAAGDLDAAQARHDEALQIRRRLGEQTRVAESMTSLAVLALERGDAALAERLAREATTKFQRAGAQPNEALALTVLAQALLHQQRLAAALEAVARADGLEKSEYRAITLVVSIARARVGAAAGASQKSTTSLAATVAKAESSGLLGLRLEALLALGEIELRGGDGTARARLRSLQEEATARGYVLVARKAEALSR